MPLHGFGVAPADTHLLQIGSDRLLNWEQSVLTGLALLFKRLSRRAVFTRTPICPSMLRDTYAIRYLQSGGELTALREQLGVACLSSVKRYQHFCEQRKEERQAQAYPPASPFLRREGHRQTLYEFD